MGEVISIKGKYFAKIGYSLERLSNINIFTFTTAIIGIIIFSINNLFFSIGESDIAKKGRLTGGIWPNIDIYRSFP